MSKSKGKTILSVVGFALGAMSPWAFGLKASAWLTGGLYGASLAGSLWTATHKQKSDSSSSSYNFDQIMNSVSSEDRIPIIYGTRKWGGNQTYHKASDDKKTLVKDIVFSEGEIEAITDVRVDDMLMGTTTLLSIKNTKYSDATIAIRKVITKNNWKRVILYYNGLSVTFTAQGTTQDICNKINSYSNYGWVATTDNGSVSLSSINNVLSAISVYNKEYIQSTQNLDGCSYSVYTGSSSQTPPDNYTTVGGYRKCAWIRATLKSSDKLTSSNPTVTAVIKGIKLYDTRTGIKAYSENPAMCVRDYLLSKRYGAGHFISADILDEDSFEEIADYCDELVTTRVPTTLSTADSINSKITELKQYLQENPNLSSNTTDDINDEIARLQNSLININTQPVTYTLEVTTRYALNIIIAESKSHLEILQDMFAVFGGFLVFTNNKVALRCEKDIPISYAFNDDNIVKDSISYTQYPIDQSPNRYNVKFYDPDNEWTGVKIMVEDTVDQQERQKVIAKDVDLTGCTSQSQALRLARMYRDKIRLCSIVAQWQTGTMAMHLEPGDVVTLSKRLIIDGVEQWLFQDMPFRIQELSEDSGVYTIKAEQYNSSIYNDDIGAQIILKNYIQISNPFSDTVPEVTNLSSSQVYYKNKDGTIVSNLVVSWNNPAYNFFYSAIVDYSLDGTTWTTAGQTANGSLTITNVIAGYTYVVRIRVQNTAQRLSDGITSDGILVTGKDSPPNDITGLIVAQRGDYFVVSGDNPSDPDVNSIEVRFGGTSWDNSTFLGTITSFPSYIPNSGVADGTVVFRCKAIDNGGNYSTNDCEYALNVSGINDYKNIVLTRNDIGLNEGTLTNLVYLPNGGLLSPSSIQYGDYLTYGDLSIADYAEGITNVEYMSPPIDTFKVGKTGVNFVFEYNFYDASPTYGSFLNRTYGDYPLDTYGHMTVVNTVTTLIRFSNDNVTWTDWQTYLAGDYIFRYTQYKLSATYESVTARAIITKLLQYYDVPDLTFSQKLTISASGLDVVFANYGVDFYSMPTEIIPTVINGGGNVYPDILNESTTGLHIDCYDRTGAKVSGTVLLVCKGY